jgi:phospholipase/carboxylesterase
MQPAFLPPTIFVYPCPAMADLLYAAHVPEGENLPAVIVLHGWGASAHDLISLAPALFDGKAVVLCPQGPVQMPIGGGMKGYGWFQYTPGQPPPIAAFQAVADRLRSFVEQALSLYSIDPQRVAVLGFSQGGIMAYELGLREPQRFAGIAALSTWLPEPLTATLPKLPEHDGFPVLVLHGTHDPTLPIERARESREALRPFGVAMTYRELDMGHEINQDALRILMRWLDQRVLRRPSNP